MIWFLSTFGDSLKRNIIYSSCTPRLHHVGEVKRFPHARASHTDTTVAWTVLPWPATPRRMADDLSRTLAIMPRLWWPTWLRGLRVGLCRPIAWGPHEAAAEEIELRAAEHLALQHFEAVDMPFDRPRAPG